MTDFAWTPGAGAYKHFPQYVNLTGNKLTVRGPEFEGEGGYWQMGPTVSIELPADVLRDLALAAMPSRSGGEGWTRCTHLYLGEKTRCGHRLTPDVKRTGAVLDVDCRACLTNYALEVEGLLSPNHPKPISGEER